jgi:SAM-dependent methyltransferase
VLGGEAVEGEQVLLGFLQLRRHLRQRRAQPGERFADQLACLVAAVGAEERAQQRGEHRLLLAAGGRPGWAEGMLDVVPVLPGSDVVDLAAGTGRGKLARLLATRHRVVCVEPDEEMRRLIDGLPAVAGTAEAMPVPNESADAVFAGEAFHWFASAESLTEIARVLRLGGTLAICFSDWEAFEPELPAEARALLRCCDERFGPAGGPKVRSGEWKKPLAGSGFGALQYAAIPHAESYDRARVVALFSSMSNVARQPTGIRRAFAEELTALLPDTPRTLRLRCDAYWTALPLGAS